MNKEALRHYLMDCLTNEDEEDVERFIYDRDANGLQGPEAALTALRTVKVCDPACGSGAYLLGMLRELLELRSALFAARELDDYTMYQRKQEIIEQNLYGVDIDDFAVGIARLRLWLSLVVDDQRNPLDTPEAEVALPNLDYKIEVGDALTAPSPQGAAQLQDEVVRQFQQKKAEYMQVRNPEEKEQLQKEIGKLRQRIAAWAPKNGQEDSFNWAVEFAEVFINQSDPIATWTGELPLKSAGQQAFMEEDSTSGGFDIVLANPPYMRSKVIKQQFGDDYKDRLKSLYPKTYTQKKADIYVAFFTRAFEILRSDGVGSFISSNKWLHADYGEDLRQFLLDDKAVRTLVDFGELPVFGAATDPVITIWQKKSRNHYATDYAKVKDLDTCYEENVRHHIDNISEKIPYSHFIPGESGEKYRLIPASRVKAHKKMEEGSTRLSKYTENMYRGVLTGLNAIWVDDDGNLYKRSDSKPESAKKEGVFIIGEKTRNEIISEDESSKEIIKPLLKGGQVRRYEIQFRNIYLIFSRRGIEIEKYGAVLKHLSKYKKALKPTPSGRFGRKPGSYEWYEIQDSTEYYELFEDKKILYPEIGKEQRFVLEEGECYTNNKAFLIPGGDWFLLGVLNSLPVWEYLKNVCSVLGDADEGGRIEYRKVHVETLPIPDVGEENRSEIASLAERAQQLHMERRDCVE
ncbi:MAG: Eco57I restriction-modification methylase domain-containing protein, partial [Candidatus Aenigmatarchaeota archaeon]